MSRLEDGRTWATLPEQILIRIFEHGSLATLQNTGLPFAVLATRVCKRWKSIALLAPTVWSAIPVHPNQPHLTELFLSCAGPSSPLSICVHTKGKRWAPNHLERILEHAARVKRLCVWAHRGAVLNDGAFLIFSQPNCFPALEHLELMSLWPQGVDDGRVLPINVGRKLSLKSLVLHRVNFYDRSRAMKGLTRLVWAIPVHYTLPLSYASLRDVALSCPSLEHLTLDAVFPILTNHFPYPKLHFPKLTTLALTMDRAPLSEKALANDPAYLSDYLSLFCTPALHTFAFNSTWPAAWTHLWRALPVANQALASIRTLRLASAGAEPLPDAAPGLYAAFPELRCLAVPAAHASCLLRPWIAHLTADEGHAGWQHLELLTLRGASLNADVKEDVELIGDMRAARGAGFEVFWDVGGGGGGGV